MSPRPCRRGDPALARSVTSTPAGTQGSCPSSPGFCGTLGVGLAWPPCPGAHLGAATRFFDILGTCSHRTPALC